MTDASVAAHLDEVIRYKNLEVRLAQTPEEVDEVLALRYRVFYKELGAKPTGDEQSSERDVDAYDSVCDHLIVIDHASGKPVIAGTYRLIRREAAVKVGCFYSSTEFDITPLLSYPGELLELGRSCIAPECRSGTIMQLLWRGLAAYIFRHSITLMFGCASFHGTDPAVHARALSYLYYHHLAPPALRARAIDKHYVDMRLLPREAFDPVVEFDNIKMDPRLGGSDLPPLIKGYLRVGTFVGDGVFIDYDFNTTDVLIIAKTELITSRYVRHYERAENDIILP